jgi:hypothetical protein
MSQRLKRRSAIRLIRETASRFGGKDPLSHRSLPLTIPLLSGLNSQSRSVLPSGYPVSSWPPLLQMTRAGFELFGGLFTSGAIPLLRADWLPRVIR